MNRTLLALAAAGALLIAAVVPAPAQAGVTGCVRTGSYTVCRANPGGDRKDSTIINEIVKQINATGKGDTVRAAVYQWSLDKPVTPLAEAMVAAEGRGVDVRAVVGQLSSSPSANDPVIRKLKNAGVQVKQCKGGCLPNADGTRKGPDHNRFFLIDKGGEPTVLVTSLSFVRSHTTQANNMLGVHGDRELYDFYNGFWSRLYAGNWNGWTDKDKATTTDLARAWVFPRGPDPVAEQLGEITKCGDGDRVLVGHANFQSNRPAVRAQLDRIQGLGCQVRVVVLDAATSSPGWLEDKLGGSNVRVHDSMRSKFIVAEAYFGGTHRAVVWTGTHNLQGNAMKHADDNLLRVSNQAVADLYAEFFQELWRGAR
ncbi:phospholipase D-like domain-containing protein [Glycomyces sp. NPDC047369]